MWLLKPNLSITWIFTLQEKIFAARSKVSIITLRKKIIDLTKIIVIFDSNHIFRGKVVIMQCIQGYYH